MNWEKIRSSHPISSSVEKNNTQLSILHIAKEGMQQREKQLRILMTQRNIPTSPFSSQTILFLLSRLSSMDTNNFPSAF